jgi:hexulose-6-phosphate isomerase
MAATAAGLALAAVPGAGVAAQPPAKPRRTLRKAVMIGMIRDGATWEERFKVLKDAGFEGVEGDSPLPKEVKLGEILAAAEKAGIKIHGMVDSNHWAIPLNAPDATAQDQALDALSTCLRDAKTVGASSILLVPGIVNERLSYDECWTRSIALIRRALPLAKETGVKIAIENVWNAFIMSPLEAARYLDELNDPMVGWHFDIGNVINFGWPEQWVKVLGERILKLHIKDFSRKKRDDEGLWKGFNVQLGEGDAGWPRVMAGLDACGYSTDPAGRWATAEVSGGDSKRLLQVSEQMDRIFAL